MTQLGRRESNTGFSCGNLRGKDNLINIGVDRIIVLMYLRRGLVSRESGEEQVTCSAESGKEYSASRKCAKFLE